MIGSFIQSFKVKKVVFSIAGHRYCGLEPFLSCNLERRQKSLCAQLRTDSLPLAAEVMILKWPLAVSFYFIL